MDGKHIHVFWRSGKLFQKDSRFEQSAWRIGERKKAQAVLSPIVVHVFCFDLNLNLKKSVEEIVYFKITLLPKLNACFQLCVLNEKTSSPKEKISRANILITQKNEAEYFKTIFSKLTNTEGIVYRNTPN